MKSLLVAAIAACRLALSPDAANAEPITFKFTGNMTRVFEASPGHGETVLGTRMFPGQPFVGFFTYDPLTSVQPDFLDRFLFNGAPFGMSLTLGGITRRMDSLFIRDFISRIGIGGVGKLPPWGSLSVTLNFGSAGSGEDPSRATLPSAARLVELFALNPASRFFKGVVQEPFSEFDHVMFFGDLRTLQIHTESPAPIPEPGTLALAIVACAAAMRRYRRR